MKKFIACFLLAAFWNITVSLPALSATVKVKEGIRIPVVVTYLKTSKNTIAGEKINIK